ncbi:MAG: myxococcus cysteine-rich repeat containing protein [Sandaracinaceae bacterium]
MRSPSLAAVLALVAATSCAPPVEGRAMAIHDPLALIDDVEGPLRLFVLPGDTYACDGTTGMVSPEVPDVPEGMFLDAIADLSLNVTGSMASTMLEVPEGNYTVLVRGKGTDPVTLIPDVFIATGCATSAISNGDTREVRITLQPIFGMGVCGDGTFSPDEQCEDGNTMDGDGCSSACRTEPFIVNTTTAGVQNHASVGGAPGQRWSITYDSTNTSILLRTLAPDGSTITSPSVLAMDADMDTILSDVELGSQLLADVAVASDGRIGLAFVDFNAGPDIRVAFFGSDRVPQNGAASIRVYDGSSGSPGGAPAVAFAGDGTMMVVYEDATSSTGLSGATFASGSFTPNGPFAVGGGLSAASQPDVAGTSDGFVVVMSAGGDLHLQRFGADGTARDAAAAVVSAGTGVQDQGAVAATRGGDFLVVWRDEQIDGNGAGIGARAYAADGTPRQEAFVLNTETSGAQSQPAVAAGTNSFLVAFVSGSTARARYVSSMGDPLTNREQPPTSADFPLSPSATEVAAAGGGTDSAPVAMVVLLEGDDVFARFLPL